MTGPVRSEAEQRLLYAVSMWLRRAMLLAVISLAVSWVPGPWWNLLAVLVAAIVVEMLPPYERWLALRVCTPRVRAAWAWLATAPPEEKREVKS